MNANDSFVIGFNYGKANGRILSSREIEVQFPDVDEAGFRSGNEDGVANDRFRLDMVLGKRS